MNTVSTSDAVSPLKLSDAGSADPSAQTQLVAGVSSEASAAVAAYTAVAQAQAQAALAASGSERGGRAAGRPAIPSLPTHSKLEELFDLLGRPGMNLSGFDNLSIPTRRVRSGHILFHEGAQATHIHFVRVGGFKCVQTAEDGYEQVLSFGFKSEALGFDALCTGVHPCSAVALEDSTVLSVPSQELFDWGKKLPDLHFLLSLSLSRELTRRSDIAGMMAAVGAEVRLARFLIHLGRRMAAFGRSSRHMYLRMTRRDIASHLGVAHETVSRSFTALSEWGYIRVMNRDVEVLDADGLRAFSLITRGVADPHAERNTQGAQDGAGKASAAKAGAAGLDQPQSFPNLVSSDLGRATTAASLG
jgi:CRP/FNR family transcriptional regulator